MSLRNRVFCITGRIVNRFSSDLYTVDDSLPFILNIFLAQVVGVIGPIVVTTYAVPWIIIGTYKFSIEFAFQKEKKTLLNHAFLLSFYQMHLL